MSNELQYWPIEFLLVGKVNYYPGVCQGTDAQDAIKTFLENYSPSMGTIAAVRVPDVGADGKMIDSGTSSKQTKAASGTIRDVNRG